MMTMKCPECGAQVPDDAERCATCGATLMGSGSASTHVDRIADDAAKVVHDVVRAMKSVQQVGDDVSKASRAASKQTKAVKGGAAKMWKATTALVTDQKRKAKTAGRHLQSKGRSVQRHVARAGQKARTKMRSVAGRRG
jgi:hypothetical protein